jgi:cysteine desulfurase family protein (TIGR01976 family)
MPENLPPVSASLPFPLEAARRQFPALRQPFVFFDNAAGAQVPERVLAAVTDHLLSRNVQRGGPYRHSREVDAMIARARASVATLVNAKHPDEIAFGLNATAFMRSISLAIGQTLDTRNEIVVSELDHEANIATWLALEQAGARIVWWRVRDDARLYTADLDQILTERTRIVACTVASNATGSLVEVADVARRAHAVGAEVFLDAVHYGPHGPIDVEAFGCDYLACSGYKIFSPHMGFAWCRPEAIDRLPTFREHFIPDAMPYKLEAGTYAYENVAGMDAAVSYLEDLGRSVADDKAASRREVITTAMTAITSYERALSAALLDAIEKVPGATVHGVTSRERLHERVPTVSFTIEGIKSSDIAARIATRDIGVRSGNMYSPRLMSRLGRGEEGTVRASLVHYNSLAEIVSFGKALREVVDELR